MKVHLLIVIPLIASNIGTFLITKRAVTDLFSFRGSQPQYHVGKEEVIFFNSHRHLERKCCVCQPSTSTDLPLATMGDFRYTGAFRLRPGEFGGSGDTFTIDYAVGTLAYHPTRNSLFIAGHAQQTRIAEFSLNGVTPGMQSDVASLPMTSAPDQGFFSPLDALANPEGLDRITGMLVVDGSLLINLESWYDAGGSVVDTTLVVDDASNIEGSVDGLFEMTCHAQGAGYMGRIPEAFRDDFGGAEYYTGWSSVYSITSRYSQGPSFWTFDPFDITNGNAGSTPQIDTRAYMNFPYTYTCDQCLSSRAVEYASQGLPGPFAPADPLWNILSTGVYGFFVPNSRTFCVIGTTGGISSGIGYKAVQSNGYECGGPCAYDPDDHYNYVWLFDVEEMAKASNVYDPRPYAYGEWDVPFDNDGEHAIIGGVLDEENGVLYVALSEAAQVGDWDRPPLIVTFTFR